MGARREAKRGIALELETKDERDRQREVRRGRVKTGEEGKCQEGRRVTFQHEPCTSQFLSLPGCGTMGRSPDLPPPRFALCEDDHSIYLIIIASLW